MNKQELTRQIKDSIEVLEGYAKAHPNDTDVVFDLTVRRLALSALNSDPIAFRHKQRHDDNAFWRYTELMHMEDMLACANADDIEMQLLFMQPPAPEIPVTTDLATDAARWRALVDHSMMNSLGWAGFDDNKPGATNCPEYRHFGMDFTYPIPADYDPVKYKHFRKAELLTAFADNVIAHQQSVSEVAE